MLKYYAAKVLRWSYSAVEAASEALGMVLSVLGLIKEPTPGDIVGAVVAATAVGASEGVGAFHFQGSELEENILGDKPDEDNQNNQVTLKQQIIYILSKYLFNLFTLGYDGFQYIFFYSTFKALINNLNNGTDEAIAYVSPAEAAVIIFYYLAIKVPSSLTNKLPQGSNSIMRSLGISPEQAFDKPFSDKLIKLVKPLAQNQKFRTYIRTSLTFQQTVEEVLPVILIVPTPLIRQIIGGPAALKGVAGILASTTLGLLTLTTATNVYLFEGYFSDAFLKSIADIPQNDVKPWVNPTVSKIFMKLLLSCGFIHGSGVALDFHQGLKEFNVSLPLNYTLSAISLIIAWLGNHFSEVKSSQKVLAEITLGSEEVESLHSINSTPLSLFFKKYGYGATKTTYESGLENFLKPIPEEDLPYVKENKEPVNLKAAFSLSRNG